MHQRNLVLLLTALLVLLPAPAVGQQPVPDSLVIQAATATLRSDLTNFVTAQEAYFADHVTYARSLRQMRGGYRLSPGVTLVLLTASDSGHSEIAIIDRVPGLVCAMFVGNAPRPLGAGGEGKPVCRGP